MARFLQIPLLLLLRNQWLMVFSFVIGTVISVAPSPSGGLFATGSGDMRARIWRFVSPFNLFLRTFSFYFYFSFFFSFLFLTRIGRLHLFPTAIF